MYNKEKKSRAQHFFNKPGYQLTLIDSHVCQMIIFLSLLSSFIIQNGTNLNLYIHRFVPRISRREWQESQLKWLCATVPIRRQLNQSGEWKGWKRGATPVWDEKLGLNCLSDFTSSILQIVRSLKKIFCVAYWRSSLL